MKKLIEPKKETAKKYGYNIAEILNNKDCPFTLTTLAEKVDISAGGMSNLINGVNTPSIDTMENIAKTLNVSIDFLLGNTNNPTLNRDLDIVYDYTRLSKESVKRLNACKSDFIDILNSLLENNNFWRLLDRISQYRKLSDSVVPFEKWLNDGVYVSCDDLVDENPIETINKRDLSLFQIQEIIKDIAKDGANNGNNK